MRRHNPVLADAQGRKRYRRLDRSAIERKVAALINGAPLNRTRTHDDQCNGVVNDRRGIRFLARPAVGRKSAAALVELGDIEAWKVCKIAMLRGRALPYMLSLGAVFAICAHLCSLRPLGIENGRKRHARFRPLGPKADVGNPCRLRQLRGKNRPNASAPIRSAKDHQQT